ncbi:MAG: rhamnan synthesis F family protein [Chthoniobacterales bacterium]
MESNSAQFNKTESAQVGLHKSWFARVFYHWKSPALPVKQKTTSAAPASSKSDSVLKRLNSVFHAAYYLSKNPAAADSDLTPLEHYRTIGWKKNRQPHPLFDVTWYLRQNPEVAASGQEPLQHYLEHGWKMGCSPHLFFDPQYYLQTYPNVAAKDQEPLGHYLQFGWKRDFKTSAHGRFHWQREFSNLDALINGDEISVILGLRFFSALKTKSPNKPAILLVTHESTRTGAPIMLLNIAKILREKYFIILLDFCEDALQPEFQQASDYYAGFGTKTQPRMSGLTLHLQLLLAHIPIHFALVNTLASTKILSLLSRHSIPSVHLVHEFAESCRRSTFRDAVFRASKMAFPSQLVLDSATRACPDLKTSHAVILPQGICPLPAFLSSSEKETVPKAIRPSGWEDAVIILGMGSVEYRKGADLFFLCANQLIQRNPDRKIRFVWIGSGLVAEQNNHFCVYLKDQLKEASTDGAAVILEDITNVGLAYSEADVFFDSSRQDPFALVAQEAMHHALPVMCFAEATGTAEVLSAEPVTRECVLPYLDIEAACCELQKLIADPALRTTIGLKCQQIAATLFDFDNYATQVEKVALEQVELTRELNRQTAEIDNSKVLDLDYLSSPIQPEIWADPSRWFVHSWSKGMSRRKPFPGFHPGIYAERNQILAGDPLVHFLRTRQPLGPWLARRIHPLVGNARPIADCKIALHIHFFYADMAEEISRRLLRNRTLIDLFISVPDEETAELARRKFSACANRMKVAVVPNRGRDIGAFLKMFTREVARDYDIVGHLHTKKSLHSFKLSKVALWKEFLFENHVGGSEAMMDAILSAMVEDPKIGIVFPDDPNVLGWGKNFPVANDLLTRMKLPPVVHQEINFPAGTFFWARTAALQRLLDLDLQWEDFPEEPVPMDGTILHAIERLLPLITESAGFYSAITAVPGFTR